MLQPYREAAKHQKLDKCLPCLTFLSLSLTLLYCSLLPSNFVSTFLHRLFMYWSQLLLSILCCFSRVVL